MGYIRHCKINWGQNNLNMFFCYSTMNIMPSKPKKKNTNSLDEGLFRLFKKLKSKVMVMPWKRKQIYMHTGASLSFKKKKKQ